MSGLLAVALAQEPPAGLTIGQGVAVVPVEKIQTPAPLFFSAEATVNTTLGMEWANTTMDLALHVLQGKAETLSLSLHGSGEIISVTGEGLKDWSVRTEPDGKRFLDLHPLLAVDGPKDWKWQVTGKADLRPTFAKAELLLPGAGNATGFTLVATLQAAADVDLRVLQADGLLPVEGGNGRKFQGSGLPLLIAAVSRGGVAPRELDLT
ncbi:MAG: hypothetical protein WCH40_09465, partial [Verrucomicrobiales bacterium]